MPSTFAGQLTILSISLGILVILFKAKKVYDKRQAEDSQHREWLELVFLEYCRKTGYPVSDLLIKKHMKINGNIKKTAQEKDLMYGMDRPKEHDSDELIIDSEGKVIQVKVKAKE